MSVGLILLMIAGGLIASTFIPEPEDYGFTEDDVRDFLDNYDDGDESAPNGTDEDDVLGGTTGDDTINLGAGDDATRTAFEDPEDAGDDFIRGEAGDDVIADFKGSNTLLGSLGNDILIGTDTELGQADELFGGFGHDVLIGDDGDLLDGGQGSDFFVVDVAGPDADPVTIQGFGEEMVFRVADSVPGELTQSYDEDNDLLTLSIGGQAVALMPGQSPIELDLIFVDRSEAVLADSETSLFGPFELSDEDDFVILNGLGQEVSANGGDDIIVGSTFDDNINLGSGNDIYVSFDDFDDGGDDTVRGGVGADVIYDSIGSDTIFGGFGMDEIHTAGGLGIGEGGSGFDPNPDVVDGGGQADTITSDNGDIVTGGAGDDTFIIRVSDPFEEDPVTITDYTPGGDTLTIRDEFAVDGVTSLSFVEDGADTLVVMQNSQLTAPETVARIQGVAVADLGFVGLEQPNLV